MCTLVQKTLLLTISPIGVNSSEFQGGKLNFDAIFVRKLPFSRQICFPGSILLFEIKVLPRERNDRYTFPGESAHTWILEAKGTEEHIPKVTSPVTKVTASGQCHSNCHCPDCRSIPDSIPLDSQEWYLIS